MADKDLVPSGGVSGTLEIESLHLYPLLARDIDGEKALAERLNELSPSLNAERAWLTHAETSFAADDAIVVEQEVTYHFRTTSTDFTGKDA